MKGKTPYEAWTGKKPNVSHFREFRSDIWVLDESKNRSKLAPKSKKMIFVGFLEGSKAVRYWDKEGRAVRVSMNFAFNEGEELKELLYKSLKSLVWKLRGREPKDQHLKLPLSPKSNKFRTIPNHPMIKIHTTYVLGQIKLTIDN